VPLVSFVVTSPIGDVSFAFGSLGGVADVGEIAVSGSTFGDKVDLGSTRANVAVASNVNGRNKSARLPAKRTAVWFSGVRPAYSLLSSQIRAMGLQSATSHVRSVETIVCTLPGFDLERDLGGVLEVSDQIANFVVG
jgi:hypothetical protein